MFPAPPQVVSGGGPVLTAPQIYPVFFSNDDAATVATLADFSLNVGGTPYWTATTSEYGVGAFPPATPPCQAHRGGPRHHRRRGHPELAGHQVRQRLRASPPPAPTTLIIVYCPTGTSVTLQGAASCTAFGGYHSSAAIGGQQIAYAVVPRCSGIDPTGALTSCRKLVEASTDAHPLVNPAYVQVDAADIYWQLLLGGGEVGDMCAQFPNVFVQFPPFAHTVQRTWSNASAKAGHDPCVLAPAGEVYFNAAPVLPDVVPWTLQGQTVMIKAVQIPVGGTMTIPVQLFSDGPWPPGRSPPSIRPSSSAPQRPLLNLSLDTPTEQERHDVLHLHHARGARGRHQQRRGVLPGVDQAGRTTSSGSRPSRPDELTEASVFLGSSVTLGSRRGDGGLPRGLVRVPRSRAPSPRGHVPAPRSRAPAPRCHVSAPRSRASSPRCHTPAPGSRTPSPRFHTPAPRSRAPSPRCHVPAPRGRGPRPRCPIPTPRSRDPSPRGHTPAPRSRVPSPRFHAPAPRSRTPSPRCHVPVPRGRGPRPRCPIPAPGSPALAPRFDVPTPGSRTSCPGGLTRRSQDLR